MLAIDARLEDETKNFQTGFSYWQFINRRQRRSSMRAFLTHLTSDL
jgi:uncharacterized ferritin-like protein (DUF455 family)